MRTSSTAVAKATLAAVAFLELTASDASAQDAGAPAPEGRAAEGAMRPPASNEPGAPEQPAEAPGPKAENPSRFASFGSAPTNGTLEDRTPAGTPRARPPGVTARNARSGDITAEAPDEQRPLECDGHFQRAEDVRRCRTPREGTPSGGYLAVDLGFVTPRSATADRVGIGSGFAANLRIGVEFWDQLVLGIGVGFFNFSDERPTSQSVVTCVYENGVKTVCDTSPHEEKSNVTAWAGILEAGYQRRFRPSRGVSLTPGLLMGLQLSTRMSRGISNCGDCSSSDVDASASGAFLSPFFRMTFGRDGTVALVLRSEWFVVGDLLQTTLFGLEYGLP